MAIISHAQFHFNRLTLILIFGIRGSDPLSWRMTEKAGPDRVKVPIMRRETSAHNKFGLA